MRPKLPNCSPLDDTHEKQPPLMVGVEDPSTAALTTNVLEAHEETQRQEMGGPLPLPHIRLSEAQNHINWLNGFPTKIHRKGGRFACEIHQKNSTILQANSLIELIILLEQELLNTYLFSRKASLKMKTPDQFDCLNTSNVVINSAPWEYWTQFMVDHRLDLTALTFDSFAHSA